MKNKIINIGVVILVILLLLFGINKYFNNRDEKLLNEYKKTLIQNDSLRKISDGHYQKLVNDLYTQKQLLDKIKLDNIEMYKYLKTNDKKPISYTNIIFKPEDKEGKVPLNIREKDGLVYFNDYYPNKEDYFINYNGIVGKDSIQSTWNFQDINIGIVVSEKTKGLFEADLTAPKWIKVSKVEVNSLPLENIKQDNFDWLLGFNGGMNYISKVPNFGLEAGFRYKRNIFSVQSSTNNDLQIGYKKLF